MSTYTRPVCEKHALPNCFYCARTALLEFAPPTVADAFARIVEDSNIGIARALFSSKDIDTLIDWVKGEPKRARERDTLKAKAEEAPLPGEPVRLPSPERCPHPGCPGVKGHVECPECGKEHCSHLFG